VSKPTDSGFNRRLSLRRGKSWGLTFELSRPWRQTPAGRAGMILTTARSGQTVAAVAGRRLERGVRRHALPLSVDLHSADNLE
jgi:hypothetical protein